MDESMFPDSRRKIQYILRHAWTMFKLADRAYREELFDKSMECVALVASQVSDDCSASDTYILVLQLDQAAIEFEMSRTTTNSR